METSKVNKIEWVDVLRAGIAWAVVYTIGAAIGLFTFLGRELMNALGALGHPFNPTVSELARISVFGAISIVCFSVANTWLYLMLRAHSGNGLRSAFLSGLFIWLLSVVAPVVHLVVFRVVSTRFAAIDIPGECLLLLVASIAGARTYEWSARSRAA